jgi:hypothetical protein
VASENGGPLNVIRGFIFSTLDQMGSKKYAPGIYYEGGFTPFLPENIKLDSTKFMGVESQAQVINWNFGFNKSKMVANWSYNTDFNTIQTFTTNLVNPLKDMG